MQRISIANLLNESDGPAAGTKSSPAVEASDVACAKVLRSLEHRCEGGAITAAGSVSTASKSTGSSSDELHDDMKAILPQWILPGTDCRVSAAYKVEPMGKSHLQLWFLHHLENPYPGEDDLKKLSLASGVSYSRVTSLFSPF